MLHLARRASLSRRAIAFTHLSPTFPVMAGLVPAIYVEPLKFLQGLHWIFIETTPIVAEIKNKLYLQKRVVVFLAWNIPTSVYIVIL